MFLDETQSEGGGPQGNPAEPARESQAPLLLHDMQSPEEAFGLPPSRKHPQQLVVAAILIVGAVACIFAMRQFGLGPASVLAGVEIEYQPEATTGGASARQILAELERSRKAVQVSADHIRQDPFELQGGEAGTAESDPDALSRAERARREEEERRAREQHEKLLQSELAKLQLQSVMEGSVPVARISDEIVRVGMTVGTHFTVASIEGRRVTLVADGRTFVLTMDAGGGGKAPGRPRGRN